MIRFPTTNFRYVYRIIFVVWLLMSTHVAYMYVSFSSDSQSWKGGTFIEASIGKINYLPYATAKDEDKFYQSLLFNGCVFPSISWTNITYRDELCSVTTSDYKTFIVTPIKNKERSDGSPFTLNDVYFTYRTILAENYWNIPSLDPYKNINVLADETGTLEVIFPQASIDNMIFFTNFILPAHLLANKSLENYITSFYDAPIGTNCGRLHPSPNDIQSMVFDLSLCEQTLLKYYQVKQFPDTQALESYLLWKKHEIDLVFSDVKHDAYQQNQVILNKFMTVFFNTKSNLVSVQLRRELATWMNSRLNWNQVDPPFLVKDPFLFDGLEPVWNLTAERMQTFLGSSSATTTTNVVWAAVWADGNTIPLLPEAINWWEVDDAKQEFIVDVPIVDKQTITLNFAEEYEKISVSYNDGVEYFPESYDPTAKSSLYNLNIVYRNVVEGRNVYTIKAYQNGLHTKTFTFIVHYLSKPTSPTQEAISTSSKSFRKLTFIYYVDPTTTRLVEYMKTQLESDNLLDYFVFEWFTDSNTFAGKIESWDYDLVIREINMWLRKDISNLFTSDLPNINPSRYTNQQLANAINKYFLVDVTQRNILKEEIDAIWNLNVPLVILWKELDTINIRSELDFPYPSRLYVLGRRKDFINNLALFDHLNINRDRIFDGGNFKSFLRKSDIKR